MKKKFFIIAGEASGDLLGAKIIEEIKKQIPDDEAEFIGVGGRLMQAQGLHSLFPMEDLSIMGFIEIIPHIKKILTRIKQTSKAAILLNPDYIITIDSPDFNFRVISKLQQLKAKKIHIVAPSVWAYRAGRAKKIAKLYDLLLTLLPFEPPYFTKYGLKTIFIGHPITENSPDFTKKQETNLKFREKHGFYKDDQLIYTTPGSRKNEVVKIFPEFVKAINLMQSNIKNLSVVIVAMPKTIKIINEIAKSLEVKYVIIDHNEKNDALFSCDFALAKSGSNTIEISLYKIPMIICYKVNFLTYLMFKILTKVKYANLINLILDNEIIPELLQQNCNSELISQKMNDVVNNKKIANLQIKNSEIALDILGLKLTETPSKKAASEILKI